MQKYTISLSSTVNWQGLFSDIYTNGCLENDISVGLILF